MSTALTHFLLQQLGEPLPGLLRKTPAAAPAPPVAAAPQVPAAPPAATMMIAEPLAAAGAAGLRVAARPEESGLIELIAGR